MAGRAGAIETRTPEVKALIWTVTAVLALGWTLAAWGVAAALAWAAGLTTPADTGELARLVTGWPPGSTPPRCTPRWPASPGCSNNCSTAGPGCARRSAGWCR